MTLDYREQLIFDFIKEWSKTHKEAIANTMLAETFKTQLNRAAIRSALLRLMIKGYIRENMRGNRKSYTMLRSG